MELCCGSFLPVHKHLQYHPRLGEPIDGGNVESVPITSMYGLDPMETPYAWFTWYYRPKGENYRHPIYRDGDKYEQTTCRHRVSSPQSIQKDNEQAVAAEVPVNQRVKPPRDESKVRTRFARRARRVARISQPLISS